MRKKKPLPMSDLHALHRVVFFFRAQVLGYRYC